MMAIKPEVMGEFFYLIFFVTLDKEISLILVFYFELILRHIISHNVPSV